MNTENDLEEKIQLFYTKLEREEIFEINEVINEVNLHYDTDEEDNENDKPNNALPIYDKVRLEPRFWNLEQLKTLILRIMK